ncbi:MAG: hypothetical protein EON94_14255 [Caulobacteraceae bacterium]|nr:MAG: hypothetical protein EON94_14255 [Caulobacteraceae bacterium]
MRAWRALLLVLAIVASVVGAGQAFPPEEGPGFSPSEDEPSAVGMSIARARTIEARPAPFPGDARRSADALDLEWLAARRQAQQGSPD